MSRKKPGDAIPDHVVAALGYAESVVDGKAPACDWVKRACQRHIDDLTKAHNDADYPFRFDVAAASRPCQFIELLPHVKGKWARTAEPIRLEPWQQFILTTVFGWLRKADGLRRFRTVYLEVPRKNAKSTLTSGVALYMLALDNEAGAECYSAATKKDQARIVFGDAQTMVRRSTEFRLRYGVEVFAHSIVQVESGSKFVALDAEGRTQDGLNASFVANDEVHAQRGRALYDVLETATGSREQPLIWNITTAGVDKAGICFELREYVTKILNGTVADDTFFGLIYTIDKGDDWESPAIWQKANPNFGISILPDNLERLAQKAKNSPSSQNNFLTKHLNVWVRADESWLRLDAFDACADPDLRIEDFAGRPVTIGIDLASKVDIASKVYLFEDGGDWVIFARHYVPESSLTEDTNPQYSGWAKQGWLIPTPGNVIDLPQIEADIADEENNDCDAQRFDLVEVAYDPWQATQMAIQLQAKGIDVVEYRATVANFSEPMKSLEAAIIDGKLRHAGDPVLSWMFGNVVCHLDAKDNVYPRKARPENKIDGVIAAIMAAGRVISRANAEPSYYAGEEIVI